MAKIHDKYVIELAEVIKGYGNDPDVKDPFELSLFYRFYELPNIAIQRENFLKMKPLEPRNGKWILKERREPVYDISGVKTWGIAYECSECGFIHTVIEDFGHYTFCPGCGFPMAMEKGEEDEYSNMDNSNL